MNEHPDGAFAAAHDRRHLADAEIGDDPERYRLALIGGKRSHELDRPVKGPGLVTLVAGGRCDQVVGTRAMLVGVSFRPLDRSDVVDASPGRNGEKPTSKIVLRAIESGDTRGDFHPHGRGEILSIGHSLGTEVAEEHVLIPAPKVAERVRVALLRSSDQLLHHSSIDHPNPVLQAKLTPSVDSA